MFYKVSITIIALHGGPEKIFTAQLWLTGVREKIFYGIIITHRGPGKKICGIITITIVTVEHNLEHNSPLWGQCQKA